MAISVKNYEDTADSQQLCPHTQGNQLSTYPLCKCVVDKNHIDVTTIIYFGYSLLSSKLASPSLLFFLKDC